MPRQERTKSGTGIYHVMLRGINKQDMFEDDEDYLQMTSIKTKMITEPSPGHNIFDILSIFLINIVDFVTLYLRVTFLMIRYEELYI